MFSAKTQFVLATAFLFTFSLFAQVEEMDLYVGPGEEEVIDLGELEPWRRIIIETSCLSRSERAQAMELFGKLPFTDWHQLQAIPEMNTSSIRCMIETYQVSRILRNRKEWDERTRFSYIFRTRSDILEGYHLIRMRSALSPKVRTGLILERDPGEHFWYRNGPSYIGGFLEWNKVTPLIEKLIVGDHKVTLGQGLLFNNQFRKGLVHGLGQLPVIDHSRLLPFQGVDENRALRGIALESKWKMLNTVIFASSRHQDASVSDDGGIRTLQYSGLHTSGSAIENRDRLWVNLAGMGLSFSSSFGQVSLNQIFHHQNLRWSYPSDISKQYQIYSKSFYGLSFSHRIQWRTLLLYGEVAYQPGRSIALSQGIILNAGRHNWSCIARHLPKSFIAQYTQGMFRGAYRNNETGIFLGYVFQLSKVYEVSLNFDHALKPWWSFSSGPEETSNILAFRINRTIRKRSNQSLRLGYRTDILTNGTQGRSIRLRYHMTLKVSKGLEWRTRCELGLTETKSASESSWLHYQEIKWSQLESPFHGLLRITLYETSSFDGRIYAYEHRLGGNFLIPPYYGRGLEAYIMIKYKAGPVKLSTRLSLRNRVREELSSQSSLAFALEWAW